MPGSTVLLIGASIVALLVVSLFTFLCSNRRQAHRASPSPSQRSVVDLELGLGRPQRRTQRKKGQKCMTIFMNQQVKHPY
ncbi:hypothetical protein TRIUR3_20294 [Triticum urartu]|uniref:Uncharacterized protein n=1 Tax=Triticum urartu TaxID=4572 RepID=M7ZEG3_TRIUA|nr:hypothetical protein TRIUR3_20294 [Triticum urartu]